jgi:hypothetical protein
MQPFISISSNTKCACMTHPSPIKECKTQEQLVEYKTETPCPARPRMQLRRSRRPAHHLEVEHEVQLAHVAEVAVQRLHQTVDEL